MKKFCFWQGLSYWVWVMDDKQKKKKKEPHFILVLGSCQPFPVPWVEGKAETFQVVRKIERFMFATFPLISQGKLN